MLNTEIVRGTGSFRVNKGAILLYRVGPANGQVQTHNGKPRDMRTGEKREWTQNESYETYIRRPPLAKATGLFRILCMMRSSTPMCGTAICLRSSSLALSILNS